MKGKTVAPSIRTVVRTLLDAEEQMPPDTANALFLQAPDEWMLTENGFKSLEEGIAEFFRKSDRFGYVVVHADEWRTFQQGEEPASGALLARRMVLKRHPSPAVSFPASSDDWIAPDGINWLCIQDVVCDTELRALKEKMKSAMNTAREGR